MEGNDTKTAELPASVHQIILDPALVNESWEAIRSFLPPSVKRSSNEKENQPAQTGKSQQDGGSGSVAEKVKEFANDALVDGEVVDRAWETIRENAVRAHQARGIEVGHGEERKMSRVSAAVLTSINMNRTKTATDTRRGTTDGNDESTAPKQNDRQRHLLPSTSRRLPLPGTQNDRLITERRRHLVELWVETQQERVEKQEELQRVSMRAAEAPAVERGTPAVDGEVRGPEDRVMGAAVGNGYQEIRNTGSLMDLIIDDAHLPLAIPVVPSPMGSYPSATPESTKSVPTISAPPSTTTTVRTNRPKRGLTPGQPARLAEADGDGEEAGNEAVVEMSAWNLGGGLSIENVHNSAEAGSLDAEKAETHRETVSRTMLDIIVKGTSTKAETPRQTVSTDLSSNTPNITATSLGMATMNASREPMISLGPITILPSYATDDTLAAIASETLLKVDMQRHQIASKISQDLSTGTRASASATLRDSTSRNGNCIHASATGETADLTLSPSETEIFRHSRRYSNPILQLSDTSSHVSIGIKPPVRSLATVDHGVVELKPWPKPSLSPALSPCGSDDAEEDEEAYFSATGGSEGDEGYVTSKDGSVAIEQQSSQPSKRRPVQNRREGVEEGIAQTPEGKDIQQQDGIPALSRSHSAANVMEEARREETNNGSTNQTLRSDPVASSQTFDHVEKSRLQEIFVGLSTSSPESSANALFKYFQGLAEAARVVALHYLLGYVFAKTLHRASSIPVYTALLATLKELIDLEDKASERTERRPVSFFSRSLPSYLLSTAEMSFLGLWESEIGETIAQRSTKHSAWAEFVRDLADRKLLDSAIEPGPVKETIDNLIRLGDIGPLCFFVIFCHLAKPQETPELRRVVEKVTRKLQELAKNECLPQPEKDMVLATTQLLIKEEAMYTPAKETNVALVSTVSHEQASPIPGITQNEDEDAETVSFGPAAEKELLSCLARLTATTSAETALQVFRYLQAVPMRYHSYTVDYLAHWIFANLPEAPGMACSYADFCKALQHLIIRARFEAKQGQTASALKALPMALLEESREALIRLCEENSSGRTREDPMLLDYDVWEQFMSRLYDNRLVYCTIVRSRIAEIMEKQGRLDDQDIRSLCHLMLVFRLGSMGMTPELERLMARSKNRLDHIRQLRNPPRIWLRMISLVLDYKHSQV